MKQAVPGQSLHMMFPLFDAAGRVPTDFRAEAGPAGAAEHLHGALGSPGAAAAAGSPAGATPTGLQQQRHLRQQQLR